MAADFIDDVVDVSPRSQRRPLSLAIGALALLALMATLFLPSVAPWLKRLDHWTADWRTALFARSLPVPHPRIAVVGINDTTLRNYVTSPVDRGLLAQIIAAIDGAGAQAIGIDIFFLKPTEPVKDAALTAALRSARSQIVMGAVDERFGLETFQSDFQKSYLEASGRPAGYLNLRHEKDDVVRYTASPNPGGALRKSFARLLAEAGGAAAADDVAQPVSWLGTPANGGPAFVKVMAHDLLDAVRGPEQAKKLAGRVVLLGGDFTLRDRHRTPLGVRDGEPMSGVEIHAHILAQLFEPRRAVKELSPVATWGLLLLLAGAGLGTGFAPALGGVAPYLGFGFATTALLAIDAVVFSHLHVLLPFTLALVTWVLGVTAGRFLRVGIPALRRTRRIGV